MFGVILILSFSASTVPEYAGVCRLILWDIVRKPIINESLGIWEWYIFINITPLRS